MTIRQIFIPTICSALVFVSTAISMDASPTGIRQNCAPHSRITNRQSNAVIMDLLRPSLHYSKYLPKPGPNGTYHLPMGELTACDLQCAAMVAYRVISPDPIPFTT
ncbi:MAG: hypothetical protein ABIQ57_15135, partial [Candidatus Kapaibacterium sp.]